MHLFGMVFSKMWSSMPATSISCARKDERCSHRFAKKTTCYPKLIVTLFSKWYNLTYLHHIHCSNAYYYKHTQRQFLVSYCPHRVDIRIENAWMNCHIYILVPEFWVWKFIGVFYGGRSHFVPMAITCFVEGLGNNMATRFHVKYRMTFRSVYNVTAWPRHLCAYFAFWHLI